MSPAQKTRPWHTKEMSMLKILTLATAALVLAAPAFADDENQTAGKSSQWFPGGGYGWNAGPVDNRDNDRDWNRDGDRGRWDRRDDRGNEWGNSSQILNRWAFANFDFNRDRRLDAREYALSKRAFYDLADRNGDGYISEKDWRKFVDRYAYRTDVGYRYSGGYGNNNGGYREYRRDDDNDHWRR
jgi:hypothetical protein